MLFGFHIEVLNVYVQRFFKLPTTI